MGPGGLSVFPPAAPTLASAARSVCRRKMAVRVRLTTSAMGKLSHTSSSRPLRERRYAAGSSTTSCRQTETTRLWRGLPMAWNMDPAMMQKPARGKVTPMIRRAAGPMESISSDGEKKPSSGAGITSKSRHPTLMMAMAVTTVSRKVRFTRSIRPAP